MRERGKTNGKQMENTTESVERKYWVIQEHSINGCLKRTRTTIKEARTEAKQRAIDNPGQKFFVLEAIACFSASYPELEEIGIRDALKQQERI